MNNVVTAEVAPETREDATTRAKKAMVSQALAKIETAIQGGKFKVMLFKIEGEDSRPELLTLMRVLKNNPQLANYRIEAVDITHEEYLGAGWGWDDVTDGYEVYAYWGPAAELVAQQRTQAAKERRELKYQVRQEAGQFGKFFIGFVVVLAIVVIAMFWRGSHQ